MWPLPLIFNWYSVLTKGFGNCSYFICQILYEHHKPVRTQWLLSFSQVCWHHLEKETHLLSVRVTGSEHTPFRSVAFLFYK